FVVSQAPGDQFLPACAAIAGDQFLVVWSDNRGGAFSDVSIYGTRVGATGAPLDPNGIKIRPGTAPNARLAPAVAAKTDGWLVAWEDWRLTLPSPAQAFPAIWSTTVSAAGQVGTEQAITTSRVDAPETSACA